MLLLFFCLNLSAQDETASFMYCEIVGKSTFMSNKINVEINYGQDQKWLTDHRIVDEKGKTLKFNNMIDALNYMGAKGWKFVHAYEVKDGEEIVRHWLLEREKDETAIPKTHHTD